LRKCHYEDKPEGCTRKRCSLLHKSELDDLARLDVHLAKHASVNIAAVSAGNEPHPTLSRLSSALASHRLAMLVEAKVLLKRHGQRLSEARADLEEEEASPTRTAAQAARKAVALDALRARVKEIEQQRAEFEVARSAFVVAEPESFVAARLFAREVYNRYASSLPIYAERQTILEALRDDYSVLVLSAETGSGKSTQVRPLLRHVVAGRLSYF